MKIILEILIIIMIIVIIKKNPISTHIMTANGDYTYITSTTTPITTTVNRNNDRMINN